MSRRHALSPESQGTFKVKFDLASLTLTFSPPFFPPTSMGLNYGGSSTGPSSGGSGRLHCHCPRNSTLALFVLFFTLAISLILLILAGTLAGTWVPMINIVSAIAHTHACTCAPNFPSLFFISFPLL